MPFVVDICAAFDNLEYAAVLHTSSKTCVNIRFLHGFCNIYSDVCAVRQAAVQGPKLPVQVLVQYSVARFMRSQDRQVSAVHTSRAPSGALYKYKV